MKGAVGEQGESNRFLCIHGHTVAIRKLHREVGQQFREPAKQQPIVRSATRDNQAMEGDARKNEVV